MLHPAWTKAGCSRTLQFIHTFYDRALFQSIEIRAVIDRA